MKRLDMSIMASHRFRKRARQLRKEEERKILWNIARLKMLAYNAGLEKEYYQQERDYFRNLLRWNPSQSRPRL